MLVELTNVGKRFGTRWVLAHLDLTVRRGEALALFGGNGSGKTTLLKIIATLLEPSTGRTEVFGLHPNIDKRDIRRRLRFLGHEKQLYGTLTTFENLRLFRTIVGNGESDADLLTLLERLDILHAKDRPTRTLSEGMKKRLALTRLLLGKPELILLDEPYPGLDQEGKKLFDDLVREWRRAGMTLLIASHDHEVTTAHVDRVVTLDEGMCS